nr:MAG TPA: hydroxyacylglutathione hydrolase [Caudoviricetes sp.]
MLEKVIKPFQNIYLKLVLYFTHTVIHESDHINWTTYKKIKEDFPNIKTIGNNDVNNQLIKRKLPPLDIIVSDNFQFKIGDVKFTCIQNYHGEPNTDEFADTHGLILETDSGETMLFATDLSTMIDYEDYLDKNKLMLDTILLEANYDGNVIEFYESTKRHTGYSIFSNGSFRHLDVLSRTNFVDKYKKPDTIDVELHQSATYRTFEGLIKRSKGTITMEDVEEWKSKQVK